MLGIPTVSDRIAQMVINLMFELSVESHFLPDSYGYRLKKYAIDAIGGTRSRCWKYNYVLEFDINGLFDNIDHELLMKAVDKHTDCKMIKLYIKRWITAPVQGLDSALGERTQGTPQGGVISPLLSNSNFLWIVVTLELFTKECLCSLHIPFISKQEFNRID